MILADGRHEPKVRQGVTTELVGVDGNGFAPFERREDLEAFVELDAGPRRPARTSTTTGRSVASYLARYDGTVSLNVATLVGNSAAADRGARLGRRRRPTTAALDRMRGAAARRAWPRARSGSAPGSTTRRARTPRPRSWPR